MEGILVDLIAWAVPTLPNAVSKLTFLVSQITQQNSPRIYTGDSARSEGGEIVMSRYSFRSPDLALRSDLGKLGRERALWAELFGHQQTATTRGANGARCTTGRASIPAFAEDAGP